MKIFLCDTESYLGKPLKAHFTREGTQNEILEVQNWSDNEEIQAQLKEAELIVLDLLRNPHHASNVLSNLRPEEFEGGVKTIVGVSSIMTWNKTSSNAKPKPLKEADYKGRKTSTKFKGLKLLESLVLNASKEKVKTYVLASGVLYGNGEEEFAPLLKDGWLCENPAGLDILGEGNNIIPCLHVNDVPVALEALMVKPPETNQYVVVTDNTNWSQKQIVECISTGIGLGKTKNVDPTDEKILLGNNSGNVEVLLANLTFEPEGSWQVVSELKLSCEVLFCSVSLVFVVVLF